MNLYSTTALASLDFSVVTALCVHVMYREVLWLRRQKRWYVQIWTPTDTYVSLQPFRSQLKDQLQYNLFFTQFGRLFINSPTLYLIICVVLSRLQNRNIYCGEWQLQNNVPFTIPDVSLKS